MLKAITIVLEKPSHESFTRMIAVRAGKGGRLKVSRWRQILLCLKTLFCLEYCKLVIAIGLCVKYLKQIETHFLLP